MRMRAKAGLALCVVALVLAASLAQAAGTITGKVVRVADGDTVTVLTPDRQQIKVRLYGIDCPEKRQAYGNRSRQAVASMIAGKTVRVRSMGVDRALVRQGMAWVYTRYCKAPECRTWHRDEAEAQAARRGLWADPHATPPWEWRRANR